MTVPSIGYDHLEQISKAIGTITIDPIQSLVQYLFPFIGTYFTSYYPLAPDPTLEAAMPIHDTNLMLREIQNLTQCANLSREVGSYTCLSQTFSSCGGSSSLTRPTLFMPEQQLFRRQGLPPFPQERADDNLATNQWILSDNEIRFFIARELGHMQMNSSLIKLALKIAIFATVFAIFANPFGLMTGFGLYFGSVAIYIFSERNVNAETDLLALKILARRGINRVKDLAIQALEKMRSQNLYRRENSLFARLFILESGDNLLDLMHPFLTTRIERLRCEENF